MNDEERDALLKQFEEIRKAEFCAGLIAGVLLGLALGASLFMLNLCR